HDAVGLSSLDDFPQPLDSPKHLAAWQFRSILVRAAYIPCHGHALLGVFLDMLGDLQENLAISYQQKMIASYHPDHDVAEDDAPTEAGHHRQGAPGRHDPQRHAEVAIEVGDQALEEECYPDHQAELLDQDNLRFDVKIGVQIL